MNNLPNCIQPLDLIQEQQNDEVIRELSLWKNRGHPDESPNLPIALRKCRKQLSRLVVEKDILYCLFYDGCGKVKIKQYCVPKKLGRENVFCLHNSKGAGLFGNVKKRNFEKFRFSGSTDFLTPQLKTDLLVSNLNTYRHILSEHRYSHYRP